jgi:hypothetical protein
VDKSLRKSLFQAAVARGFRKVISQSPLLYFKGWKFMGKRTAKKSS